MDQRERAARRQRRARSRPFSGGSDMQRHSLLNVLLSGCAMIGLVGAAVAEAGAPLRVTPAVQTVTTGQSRSNVQTVGWGHHHRRWGGGFYGGGFWGGGFYGGGWGYGYSPMAYPYAGWGYGYRPYSYAAYYSSSFYHPYYAGYAPAVYTYAAPAYSVPSYGVPYSAYYAPYYGAYTYSGYYSPYVVSPSPFMSYRPYSYGGYYRHGWYW